MAGEFERQRREHDNEEAIQKFGPVEIRHHILDLVIPTDRIIRIHTRHSYRFVDAKKDEVAQVNISFATEGAWAFAGLGPSISRTCRWFRNEAISRYCGTNIFLIHLGPGGYGPTGEVWFKAQKEQGLRIAKYMIRKQHPVFGAELWLLDFQARTIKRIKCEQLNSLGSAEEWQTLRSGAAKILRTLNVNKGSPRKKIRSALDKIARL